MKNRIFHIILTSSLSLIAMGQQQKSNNIAIVFDGGNYFLGTNYHRNLTPWFGLSATLRFDSYSTAFSHDDNLGTSFPKGKYVLSNHLDIVPSIATVEPDYMVVDGDLNGIDFMGYNVLCGLGVFFEKRGLFIEKLNTKITTYVGTMRENTIDFQSAYGVNQSVGPNGEDPFQFNYYQHQHQVFWTKPYILLELQVDYTVYKDFYLGLNFNYWPTAYNSFYFQYFGSFTLGTRF